MVGIRPGRTAHDNLATTFVELPQDTAVSAIAPYVQRAIRELFVLFDGYSFPDDAIEHWVQRLIERKL
jgi:hypothetical protein